MSDLMREAPFGQLIRLVTKNRYFRYPEEKPDFQFPPNDKTSSPEPPRTPGSDDVDVEKKQVNLGDDPPPPSVNYDPEKREGSSDDVGAAADRQQTISLHRTQTLPFTAERLAADEQLSVERTKSQPIVPTTTADGTILVDWYSTDDPANPQNWSQKKKAFVALLIDAYTFVVYCGSSIYVSSEIFVMARFGVQEFKAALGLALYVLGYGVGPLIFSPMSEIPVFGRNMPYVATFAIFVVLAVPTALADNLGGLLVLRFLQGFFGSPCLANGGATMQDMYSFLYLPYSVALWVSASFAAPALGPLLSGFAVVAEGWRWSLWEILWMAGPVLTVWFFFLPETSADNILLRRAARLRRITGNGKIRSQTEIDRKGVTFRYIFVESIVKPIEIMLKDPAVLFTNVYTALVYGIYYSFFEVFVLVYPPLYGFNIGETGIVFTCIIVACVVGMAIYFSYLHFLLIPDVQKNGLRAQEWRLRPALIAVFGPPIGLFLFAWTANAHVHWMASVIGITMYSATCYIILQCIFVYIPMSYPQYAASLFAGNDFCRALFAFGAVLFSRPMFINLGIGRGVSLLAGLSVMGIIGMWLLYFYGARLRARSKFALS